MKTIIQIILFLIPLSCFSQGQTDTIYDIQNKAFDLRKNKVDSMFFWQENLNQVNDKQLFKKVVVDKLGRVSKVFYYKNNELERISIYRYSNLDTNGTVIKSIISHNLENKIINESKYQVIGGDTLFIKESQGIGCFGYYVTVKNEMGLIEEAVWYVPKDGVWSNKEMVQESKITITYK